MSRLLATKRLSLKFIGLNSIMVFLICYFIYHAFSADRGLLAYLKLKHLIQEQEVKLEDLKAQRTTLESTIKNLHPKTLDLDLLDQTAREELGLAAPAEKVIFLKQ